MGLLPSWCYGAGGSSVQFLHAAAADGEHLPADPARGGRAQEQRGIGDVGGLAEPAERRVPEHRLLDLRREHGGERVACGSRPARWR